MEPARRQTDRQTISPRLSEWHCKSIVALRDTPFVGNIHEAPDYSILSFIHSALFIFLRDARVRSHTRAYNRLIRRDTPTSCRTQGASFPSSGITMLSWLQHTCIFDTYETHVSTKRYISMVFRKSRSGSFFSGVHSVRAYVHACVRVCSRSTAATPQKSQDIRLSSHGMSG